MAKYLVIVESPSKANTIKKYLGKDYSYHESKTGFSDVGLHDKWEFINAKTKNDTFIIEYYKSIFCRIQ